MFSVLLKTYEVYLPERKLRQCRQCILWTGPSTSQMFVTETLTCAAILATLRMWMERNKQWPTYSYVFLFHGTFRLSVSSLGAEVVDLQSTPFLCKHDFVLIFLWEALVTRRCWRNTCSTRVSRPWLICLRWDGKVILETMRSATWLLHLPQISGLTDLCLPASNAKKTVFTLRMLCEMDYTNHVPSPINIKLIDTYQHTNDFDKTTTTKTVLSPTRQPASRQTRHGCSHTQSSCVYQSSSSRSGHTSPAARTVAKTDGSGWSVAGSAGKR